MVRAGRLVEIGPLPVSNLRGLSRSQRFDPQLRVPATQFGVGGHGQPALRLGRGFPGPPVVHHPGEDALLSQVGRLLPPALLRLLLMPGRDLIIARLASRLSLGARPDRAKPSLLGAGAHVAQFPADVLGRPGGLGLILVADQPQRPVRPVAQVGVAGRAKRSPGVVPQRPLIQMPGS